MKIFKHKKWIIYFVIIFGPVAWWNVNYPSASWRYKITVEVETPEGIKSGSAVREITAKTRIRINLDLPSEMFDTFGEAVVVDLGKYGTLFSLIGEHSYMQVEKAFPCNACENKISYYSNLKPRDKIEIKKYGSSLVAFSDINNPRTVKRLTNDEIPEIFEKEVKFIRETVEIINEPVTQGAVIKKLPWIYTNRMGPDNFTESGDFIPYYKRKPEDFINGSDFIREK